MRNRLNKRIACLLMIALIVTMVPIQSAKVQAAGASTWKVVKINNTAFDKEYSLEFDTGGVTYGYKNGKVVLMNTYTRKLIKITSFTEINEIRKIGNNVDAIVVKETKGKRLFGVIDKTGKTLIPTSIYTEIFFTTNGFFAIDALKNHYFLSRDARVLCEYKNGEKIVQYGNYFAVINERSLDFKEMYDYDGNKVDNIPESERTANNQYYIMRNTLIQGMIDKSSESMNGLKDDMLPAYYKEHNPKGEWKRRYSYVTPVQNCYIINILEEYGDKNNVLFTASKKYLYDLKGNLITVADDIKAFNNTKQYIVSISNDKDIKIYNARNAKATAIQPSITGEYDYLTFETFGDYIIISKCHAYDDGGELQPSAGIIYDLGGKVVEECDDINIYSNFIEMNGKYYNEKMEELSVQGSIYSATNGYMIRKNLGSGKEKIIFTDFKLNQVTSAIIKKNEVHIFNNYDSDSIPDRADFDILPNGAGVHVSSEHMSKDDTKHYFIDRNGHVRKEFSDSKGYHYYKVVTKGSTNQIAVLKTQKAATVNIGQTVISSAKNTAPGELTVKWNTIKGVTAYHVEIRREDNREYIAKDAKTNSIVVTGLKKGMSYKVQIRAYVNRGDGWDVGK
ncbi:fibronectin type III domain-containing protein [Anaeromicropila herbilytica]|uniref:Fibronectin type-III domain-containing protein n=1 Tax=Anaeromicropila herbilytica TaxID=2785025 RepID=A0A7R7EN77_9FIRM|nr:fibronectin type III domain-containing protein [Anaeromicropila herbilytica]BCN31887.1 hypothetical protein bsdtb5_31820 [Anaeromicropila herbilytica]